MHKYKYLPALLFFSLTLSINSFGCDQPGKNKLYKPEDFTDILNIRNLPKDEKDYSASAFFDLGSWFGYALPDEKLESSLGGFPGPFSALNAGWLSEEGIKFKMINTSGVEYDYSKALKKTQNYYPGYLLQSYDFKDGTTIKLVLSFISSKTAIITAALCNKSNSTITYKANWEGSFYGKYTPLKKESNGVSFSFKRDKLNIRYDIFSCTGINQTISDSSYNLKLNEPVVLEEGGEYSTSVALVMSSTPKELEQEEQLVNDCFSNIDYYFNLNKERWGKYIDDILSADSPFTADVDYTKIAVKSLLTLINNWKCAIGDLKHDGVIPSYAISYFNGFWAWDSWKHAVALTRFAPDLAKDQMRAMFDYQDDKGMIADCIFADDIENNYRDSKPPLAAWAVSEIYKYTKDNKFLEEMYPKLMRYHYWWYENRDHDNNGLCEYGSVDGTKEAAMWESGWDDAVRFDNAGMLPNGDDAWSLDQESVDLNSYLYAEKLYLQNIAACLGETSESTKFEKEALDLQLLIRKEMYDKNTKFFYDKIVKKNDLVMVQDPGGWIPLWSCAASDSQANEVVEVMLDSTKFNTTVPFPTVSKDNSRFMSGYWRGAVWIDQAYFAIRGLSNYGFIKEANEMTCRLFDNCEGLKGSQGPIRENYDPVTGAGLKVNHFSWSAAHFLLLYRGE